MLGYLLVGLLLLLPAHQARITGFHVDFEGCSGQIAAGGGAQAQQKVCGVFLAGLANISADLRRQSAGLRSGLRLSVDAGTWMACDPAQSPCTKITHAGTNKSVLEHVVDIADKIQIMDYDVTVDRVLGRATRFLDYAESIDKVDCITIGLAVAPFPDPKPVWYTLPNETALVQLMSELRPILEKRPSFAGFAVFDGTMWQEQGVHAPTFPSKDPFVPAAVWGIGPDNSIAVNRSAWAQWLAWAKSRRVYTAYIAPHAGSPWLFPVPGMGGSDEDAAAFCEFVGVADAAGIDLELYVDGWPGQGRPSWNVFGYEFVHNCTLGQRLEPPGGRASLKTDEQRGSSPPKSGCLSNTNSSSVLCTSGGTIADSNRSGAAACVGAIGCQCDFTCNDGYLAIGRHVCQTYSQGVQTFLNRTFFGGRCERLCPTTATPCPKGLVPTRFNSTDDVGPCLQTVCSTADDALRQLAKGNYALWQLARNNITGIYIAGVDLTLPPEKQPFYQGATGETGLGLTFECVADAMGWVTRADVQANILLTLRSLSGLTPGFTLPQNRRGFSPTFIDSASGAVWGNETGTQGFALMSTDLMHAGIMFVKTYFQRVDPGSAATAEIVRLASALFAGVQWDTLLCGHDGQLDPNGTNIPMVVDWSDGCSALMPLDKDGFYEFNEEFIAVWFAWQTACGTQPEGQCSNKGIERMWQRWQGRRTDPNHFYKSHPLLSLWSAYVVHLPFYMTHPFNSDPLYVQMFHSHWQAEWEFYNSSQYYAGEDGRYGLGAGPVDRSCAGGRIYAADLFLPYSGPVCPTCTQGDHCRIFSPSSVVGYLPAAPSVIRSQILALLATGETVYRLPTTTSNEMHNDVLGDFVLWRKSLLHPGWTCDGPPDTYVGVTTVDVSSELFGLSTLWLGADFYTRYTDHWPKNASIAIKTDDRVPRIEGKVPVPVVVSVAPDAYLQAALEPWRLRGKYWRGWTGGDVGASAALTPNRTLWVFGDTLIGRWDNVKRQRVSEARGHMPHSSIGVWNLNKKPSALGSMTWHWGANDSSFFRPSWEKNNQPGRQAFWAAVTTPRAVGGRVLVIGNRVLYTAAGGPMGFKVSETVIFTVDGATEQPDAPDTWVLKHYALPHTGNLSHLLSKPLVDLARGALLVGDGLDPVVYLYGYVCLAGKPSREVVSRIRWSDLQAQKFTAQEYWVTSGQWQQGWSDDLPQTMATLWRPQIAEMQIQWSKLLGAWVVVDIPFMSTVVEMRTAPAPEGPWSNPTLVYHIPSPQNDTSKFFCYSAMQHDQASLPVSPSAVEGDVVFTYVCNGRTLADVFAPGAEASYVPQFVRLRLDRRNDHVVLLQQRPLKSDDTASRPIYTSAMFWPTLPSEGAFVNAHVGYFSQQEGGARSSGGKWAASLGLTVHSDPLVNLYNNASAGGSCGCGPAYHHSPFPISGCESGKTPSQYGADRGRVVPATLIGDPEIPQSDLIMADLEGLNGMPNRIFTELNIYGKKLTDVYSNSGNLGGTSTALPAKLRFNGSYGIFDQQYKQDTGGHLDPESISFAEVLRTINNTWKEAQHGFGEASKASFGTDFTAFGEYQTYAANVGLTTNADFNALDTKLHSYLESKSTWIVGPYRKHVCFGTMAEDGMLDHFAETQVAVGSMFLDDYSHNVLDISYYPGDTTFFRYWKKFGAGFASQSLVAFEDKHQLTPQQTEAQNIGVGWAAYARAFQKLRLNKSCRYIYNGGGGLGRGSPLQLTHWWHPSLVRNISQQLFEAGADAINLWNYWGASTSSLDRWSFEDYLTFKHHFILGGLNGVLPCDDAVFKGWSGQGGALPLHWADGVDWSTVKPRPADDAFWGFGQKVAWSTVGSNQTMLNLQVVQAYQTYLYELAAAIKAASRSVPL